MGGGVSYTRGLRVGIATALLSPWEGLVSVPSAIAATPESPVATLLETTTSGEHPHTDLVAPSPGT